MVFELYSSRTLEFTLGTLAYFKFGFYMKIPPREMFVAQVMNEKTVVNICYFNILFIATYLFWNAYTFYMTCFFMIIITPFQLVGPV
jgi:hypothetical protein